MQDRHRDSASHSEAAAVANALGRMFLAFRERAEDAEAMIGAYGSVLDDLPSWAIIKACERFARGRVTDRRNAFTPTAAEMHELADGLVAEQERHERLMRPPVRQIAPPPGPSRAARLAAVKPLDDYRAELRTETVDHEAERRRAMWREIGPRLWQRFGHDPNDMWRPSAELEEIIRSKPQSGDEAEGRGNEDAA